MKPGGAVVLVMTGAATALAGCSAAAPNAVVQTAATEPVSLIGASIAGLRSAFGPPALQRIDGTAQVWLYDSRVCRLDVVLYPGPDGAPKVTAAMPLPVGVSRNSCVTSLEHDHAS